MASTIINSDDGSSTGAAGFYLTAGDDGTIVFQSNGANVAVVTPSGPGGTPPVKFEVLGDIEASEFIGIPPGFEAGTKMLFVQTTAPTGFTKSTAHDNKALRVVSGTASSGGTVEFTTAFASQTAGGTVSNHTLTTAQLASHNHTQRAQQSGGTAGLNPGHQLGKTAFNGPLEATAGTTTNTGSNSGHNHGFTGTAIDLTVQYVDVIICTKD